MTATETPAVSEDWHRGDWMQTFTGRRFHPLDPRPEDIDIRDIAHALSMACRFGGHTRRFYSVAEHCVAISRYVPEKDALWGLLHDGAEAYVGDMVRPLKYQLPPDYRMVEHRVIGAIATALDIPTTWSPMHHIIGFANWGNRPHSYLPSLPASVKDADHRILLTERNQLLTPSGHPWSSDTAGIEPLPVLIHAWDPARAEQEYLSRYAELTGVDL